jgi:hypothetical protein
MSRNTHSREHDHFGTDLDTNIVLDGSVGAISSGTTVHSALVSIADSPTTINLIIDGGGSAITAGIKGDVELPFSGVLTGAKILADQSGDIVFDLWKQVFASFPPTVTETITASAKPTIAGGISYEDTSLTGWTTTFAAGDILRINVDSASTITRATLSLSAHRT